MDHERSASLDIFGKLELKPAEKECINETANSTQVEQKRSADDGSVGAIDRRPLIMVTVVVMSNKNESEKAIVQTVQDMTSATTLHLDLTSYGIGMFSTLLLGIYSSVMSRKLLLFIPTSGYLVRLALLLIVVHWQLSVNWLFLGYAVDGVCGGTPGIMLGTFLYTSDVTPRDQKRTLGVAIIETTKGAIGGVFQIAGGQLIEHTGYIVPSTISAALQSLCLIIVLTLPDRKPGDLKTSQINSVKAAFLQMISPFWTPKSRRVKILISLAVGSFCGTLAARLGIEKVQYLYLMNFPFCFDAITIGWFLFGRDMLQHTFNILIVAFCHRYFPGMRLGIFGSISCFASFLLFGFAKTDWEIYLVPVVAIGQNLVFSLSRGEASRLLSPECQGPLMASLAFLESISFAIGSGYLSIYNASLGFFTGLTFLVSAGFLAVVLVILVLYQVLWTRHLRSIQYQTLEEKAGNGTEDASDI